MNAEKYYIKKDYPILDKFDKKAPKFDYYDFIDFAESYHKAKLNLLTIPVVIVSVCPKCKGDQIADTKTGYLCCYTDCSHEWQTEL